MVNICIKPLSSSDPFLSHICKSILLVDSDWTNMGALVFMLAKDELGVGYDMVEDRMQSKTFFYNMVLQKPMFHSFLICILNWP